MPVEAAQSPRVGFWLWVLARPACVPVQAAWSPRALARAARSLRVLVQAA